MKDWEINLTFITKRLVTVESVVACFGLSKDSCNVNWLKCISLFRTHSSIRTVDKSNTYSNERFATPRLIHRFWSRIKQIAVSLIFLFSFSTIYAQSAFSTTNLISDWDEDPAQLAAQLVTLNGDIATALNAAPNDFCFELKAEPAGILQFKSGDINCVYDGSGTNNGFDGSKAFDIEAGANAFDYDSRVRHSLEIKAHAISTTPSARTPNSLRVVFNLHDFDEPPVFKRGSSFSERRFLQVDDRIDYTIFEIYEDPEGSPLQIDVAALEICEGATVNAAVVVPGGCLPLSPNGVITGDFITTQPRGPRLYITANGPGLTAAGSYHARVKFHATDGTGNVSADSTIEIRIKNGVNNIPRFKGGATGFSVSVNERPQNTTTGISFGPSTIGAWHAEDLDGDALSHSLVGQQSGCISYRGLWVQIGQMCVRATTRLIGGVRNVQLLGGFLDYEDPALSPNKSLTVTLRATDGWDSVEIPIEVTLNNINELYLHSASSMGPVLPANVSVIEGESVSLNLSDYVTDPENDTLTYTVYAHAYTGLVNVSGNTLTISGTGTNSNNPTLTDTVTVEVTDGQLTEMRDITVNVRNTNEAPRFEPTGVIAVAGAVDENVPIGSLISGLVQYSDADSPANEIDVIVDSPDFRAIVEPLIENDALCDVVSTTCVQQTNRIALVTAAPINHESMSIREVRLGLHDGWVRSDPNQDVTVRITVNDLNDAPTAVGTVPKQSLSVQGVATFDVSTYFTDEDTGDRILVDASSRDTSIADVSVAGAAEVNVTGVGVGSTRIELTGSDLAGASVVQLFDVTVIANQAPIANADSFEQSLPDDLELLTGSIHDVPITGLFTDPDDDTISVSVETLDEDILLVAVDSGGNTATLIGRSVGTTDIVFTAADGAGNETVVIYTIAVVNELTSPNQPPEIDHDALEDALPTNRQMVAGDFHDLVLTGIFTDPEGAALVVNVSSSDTDVLQVATTDLTNTVTLLAISEGSIDLTIKATDEGDLSTETVVRITVIQDEPETENQAPILDAEAFAQALPPDNSVQVQRFINMDLRGLFTDPDGDSISLSASSSATSVLRVTLQMEGESARLIGRSVGSAILTITATDSEGNSTEASATIRVLSDDADANQPPEIDRDALVAALPTNNTLGVGGFFELQLDSVFSDSDENDRVAAFDASSSNPEVLEISIDDSNVLTALALSTGTSTLSIDARDTFGAESTVEETITVVAASTSNLAIRSQSFDRNAPLVLNLDELAQSAHVQLPPRHLRSIVGDESIVSASLNGTLLTLHAKNKGRTFLKLVSTDDSISEFRSMFYVEVVNAAPKLYGHLDDLTTDRTAEVSINLRGTFKDADDDPFDITVQTDDRSIIEVKIEDDELFIKGLKLGSTIITVTAIDVHGATSSESFLVTVKNTIPQLAASTVNIELQVGGDPHFLDFVSLFEDSDGDPLSFVTTFEANEIVRVSESESGVTFSPLSRGTVSLTITARDPSGGRVSISGKVVVSDDQLKAIASQSIAGFGRVMLSSVSSVIDTRVNIDRTPSDLSMRSWHAVPLDEYVPFDMLNGQSNNDTRDTPTQKAYSMYVAPVFDKYANYAYSTNSLSHLSNGISIPLGTSDSQTPWSLWNSIDTQTFSGDAYSGSMTNSYLGVDKEIRNKWVVGLAISRHRGDSDYSYGTAMQQLKVNLHHLTPYARYTPYENTRIWGTIAFGQGELRTSVAGDLDSSAQLSSHVALLGARQRIASSKRYALSLHSELASHLIATPDGNSSSEGVSIESHRIRAGFDGAYTFALTDSTLLTPSGQLNLQTIGGNGSIDTGIEASAGMKFSYRAIGIEVKGRSLTLHGTDSYMERGLAVSATFNQNKSGIGFYARISPRWGTNVHSYGSSWNDSYSNLYRTSIAPQLQLNEQNSEAHLDIDFGYGMFVFDDAFQLTPFINFIDAEFGSQNTMGLQLRGVDTSTKPLSLDLSFGRRVDSRSHVRNSIQLVARMNL